MSYLLEKFKMKGKIMEVCDRYARNVLTSLSTVAHTGDYNDLSNKPVIPSGQVNSDWNATSGVAEILNKPNLATVATSGNYNDLSNKPTIPSAQVNSDWNSTGGVSEILNKPSLATVATSGSYNDLTNKPNLFPTPVELLNQTSVATTETQYDLSESKTNYRFLLFAGAWIGGINSTYLLVPTNLNTEIFYVYLNNNPENAYYRVESIGNTTRVSAYASSTNVTMRVYGIK